jgi:hypothetical protein
MTVQIKTIMSVRKVLSYIITFFLQLILWEHQNCCNSVSNPTYRKDGNKKMNSVFKSVVKGFRGSLKRNVYKLICMVFKGEFF